jgi:hypothetical protein
MDLNQFKKTVDKTNDNLKLSSWILIILFFFLAVAVFVKCEMGPGGGGDGGDDNGGVCSEGLPVGDIQKVACGEGEGNKIIICREGGKPAEVLKECDVKLPPPPPPPPPGEEEPECKKVTFEQIQPLIQKSCASCHAGFVNYDVAVKNGGEIIRRIKLNSADQRRMPKSPLPELPIEEKVLFEKWQDDGYTKSVKECGDLRGTNDPESLDFGYVERTIFNDLQTNIDAGDRKFMRYLVGVHLAHESNELLTRGKQSSDKTLNSIVEKKRDITLASFVDEAETIFRVDIRSFELSPNDWKVIEKFDKLRFISNTKIGVIIRFLTETDLPWFHADNFSDIILANANLYHFLNNTNLSFFDLIRKLGVTYTADFQNFEATLLGFNGSSISRQKNRLLSRHEIRNTSGAMWVSYDIKPIADIKQRNLFNFPLPPTILGNRVFNTDRAYFHDASEVIYHLENGLLGFQLYNNKGQLQSAAPIDVVVDGISPVFPAPEIRNAISCMRCHSNGIIPATDQVRNKVFSNPTGFNGDDQERIRNLYKRQTSLNALFKVDNNIYTEALKKLGLKPGEPDPISIARDHFLTDYDSKKAAAFLFMTEEKFLEQLSLSGSVQNDIGQLSSEGGTVTADQFQKTLPKIFRDFRILEEPINGGS